MPVIQCKYCGDDFFVHNSRLALGRGIYCSKACQGADRTKKTTKHCKYCGEVITNCRSTSLYCSRQCSARAMYMPSMHEQQCLYCKKKFIAKSIRDKLCSRTCEAKHLYAHGQLKLMQDPWQSGDIQADCYDKDYWRMPDISLGF